MAGRAAAITNIMGGTTIQLEDTLNNTVYNNSNAIMTTVPTPFFCLNNADSYNPGAVDPDGDNLVFSLVDGKIGNGTCSLTGLAVTYIDSYTAPSPLAVDRGSFNFDTHTGQLSFVPNILQRALVVYNVSEYRAGTFVGSCQREMTFLVIPCTNIPPGGGFKNTTAGTIGDSTHFFICADSGAFDLTIYPQEADTNNTITTTASGLPAGAVFTVVHDGTNHPVCTFNWNSTGATPGTYIYYLTFKDNACPLSGSNTIAFTVTILALPDVQAAGGYVSCLGAPGSLTASGAEYYEWTPPASVACWDCPVTTTSVGSSTTFTVIGIDGNGCKNRATVTVDPAPPRFLHDMTVSQSIYYGQSIQLSVLGATKYFWYPNDGTLDNCNINNPVASPLEKTTYTVQGYNNTGCVDSASVTIDVITTKEVVPSGFTPNDDGLNDVFRVSNLAYGHLVEMKIINRWGQVVCQTTDNKKGWDGKLNGVPQDVGVYYYSIIVEREDKSVVYYKGDLTLIR
jgi:gliding motility-associated-like protein